MTLNTSVIIYSSFQGVLLPHLFGLFPGIPQLIALEIEGVKFSDICFE